MVNFYDHIKQETKVKYPNQDIINIPLPFRLLTIGSSGAGKSNIILNLIRHIAVFDRIILLAKDLSEELYVHLIETIRTIEKKHKIEMLLAIDNIDDLPEVNDMDKKYQTLLIVDDMIRRPALARARILPPQ